MFWTLVIASTPLLFAGASGAAVVKQQQPLQVDGFNSQFESSAALEKLRVSVRNRLIDAWPVARPCYSQPGPFSKGQCEIIQGLKTNDAWISSQPGGYFYANWASCQATEQTCAMPLDRTAVFPVNATCFQGSVPTRMIDVQDTKDIQAAFNFAQKDKKTLLVIKNTGHDWKGRSAAPGSLALWTHNLRSPLVKIVLNHTFTPLNCANHPQETVLHFGPGETWAGAYQFAENNSLAILGGTCGTVGIAGWLHGGGHSPLTPVFGMGVDNVRQVEIVTPRGEVKIANECLNADLFFAVRGGGGGTFGVVTNITYKAVPKFEIQEFSAEIVGLDYAAIRDFLEIVTLNAISWSQKGWGGYMKTDASTAKLDIEIIKPYSTLSAARQDMAGLISFLEAHGVKNYTIKTHPSWYNYYKDNLEPTNKHIGGYSGAVASRLLPASVFNNQTRSRLVNELLKLYESNLNLWLMLVTPTNFTHTTTSALHPSWKNAIWSVRINDRWDQFKDIPKPGTNRQRFENVHKAMEPLREFAPNMGVSLNEADIWEKHHEFAFWGAENYEKLREIKARVDPDNALSNYGAVGWEKGAARYKCYPK